MPKNQYQEVADTLRTGIIDGEYPPGSRLPSRRELREKFKVSGSVLDKAMLLLRQEQLVETLIGVGVFVTRPAPQE